MFETINYKGIEVLEKPLGVGGKILTHNFMHIADQLETPVLSEETEFHVSTTGSDETGDGSSASPWATLSHAMDELRKLRFKNPVSVKIAIGHYSHSSPINVSHIDGHLITIEGTSDYTRTVNSLAQIEVGTGYAIIGLGVDDMTLLIQAGDYAMPYNLSGLGFDASRRIVGCHRIISVGANQYVLRVKINYFSESGMPIPIAGTVRVLRSVFNFSSADAFQLDSGVINIKNIAIATTSNDVPGPNTSFISNSTMIADRAGFHNAITCKNSNLIAKDCGFSEGFTVQENGKANIESCGINGTTGVWALTGSDLYVKSCMIASAATPDHAMTIRGGSTGVLDNCQMFTSDRGISCEQGSTLFIKEGNYRTRVTPAVVNCYFDSKVVIDDSFLSGQTQATSNSVVTGNWNSSITISDTSLNLAQVGVKMQNWSRAFLSGVTYTSVTTQTDPALSVDDGSEIRSS